MPKWVHFEYSIGESNSGKTFAVYDIGYYTTVGRFMRIKLHGRFRSFDAAEKWMLKNIPK